MITILTGPVHAGKTSLLEEITAELRAEGFRVGGYLSRALWEENACTGYDLVDIPEGRVDPFIRREGDPTWQSVGPYRLIPEGLERAESILLRDRDADLIIVDEVGPLELTGKGVWPGIVRLIDDPSRRILLVIRESVLEPFLERLKDHPTRVIRFEDPDVFVKLRAIMTNPVRMADPSFSKDDLYSVILQSIQRFPAVVLATVIDVKGSVPQVPGASAIITEAGLVKGTVGGGFVEGAVQEQAVQCIESGTSVVLRFDLDATSVTEADLVCGGRMTVLLDASPRSHLQAFRSAADALARRERGVLATRIHPSGDGVGLSRIWVDESAIGSALEDPFSAFAEQIKQAFRTGIATTVRIPVENTASAGENEYQLYIEPVHPRFRLIIAGGGHVGKALSHLGRLLDFDVTVVDDRSEFANASNLPDAHRIIQGTFKSTLQRLCPDRDSFVVIVTRGHGKDAEALRAVINSGAGYIGMMGSSKKVALMRDHFIQSEWCTAEQFDGVHTPIGVDIPSKTVQEIAVSIAAQLIQVRNRLRSQGEKIPE